ncbi:zinc finger protein CONSTANS-LIKE 2-like [Nymphaea colorata]|nr:zinc finger protein CONSTANS-LIKE 2-like [Nymphaea colorata]
MVKEEGILRGRQGGGGLWPSREWLCEVCESAPATVTCKADSAVLCATCDADIHSANPLARRHLRVPIHQYNPAASDKFFRDNQRHHYHQSDKITAIHGGIKQDVDEDDDYDDADDEQEANSWLLLQPGGKAIGGEDDGLLLGGGGRGGGGGGEVDEYLDLVDYAEACNENQSYPHVQSQYHQKQQPEEKKEAEGNDGVVPVPCLELIKDQQLNNQQYLDFDLENPKGGYGGYPGSLSHSVSMSSLEAGVVPDAAMSENSGFYFTPSKGSMELSSGLTTMQVPQYMAMDREARVLRYREKRKNRKFEKTIRYASRKAYAETRPRIKGRFAKRTDVEIDQMYSTSIMVETGYGIVPTL